MIDHYQHQKELRHAWAQVAISSEPKYFCTMIFNRDVSMERAVDYLKELHQRIDRNLHGPKYYKKDLSLRTSFIAFPERGKKGKRERLHFHLLLKVDSSKHLKFCTRANRIWRKLCPGGIFRVNPLDGDLDILRTCLYSTKEIFEKLNMEDVIFSDSFVKGS